MSLTAALCAMLAIACLLPGRRGIAQSRSRWRPGIAGPLVALPVGLGVAHLSIRVLILTGVGVGLILAARALRAQRARRREASQMSVRVLETCEVLAAELAAGQPPGAALDRAAEAWPTLAGVAEAFRVGSDVPGALRRISAQPGAADLRLVAAAWQVAHRAGHGLGQAVEQVATGLRSAQSSRRIVQGELASARATARLVAGLPIVAWAMGSGAGGDPWGFLFGQPVGLACLVAGLACGFAGLWWIEAIAHDVERKS